MLISELFSFMKDKIELDIKGKYNESYHDSPIEAAEELLGYKFMNSTDAFTGLIAAGYQIDGKSYKKFIKRPMKIIGDYKKISERLFEGIKVKSIEEFKKILSDEGYGYTINDFENSHKFSGLNKTNFDKWINYYFNEKGIDLEYSSKPIYADDYETLIQEIRTRMEHGESIHIGVGHFGKTVSMTDGSKYGWFNFSDMLASGHAMPLIGISSNGDFIVSSWGKKQTIPKEFYLNIEFIGRKLNAKTIKYESLNNESTLDVEYFSDLEVGNNYQFIEDKLKYISDIVSRTSPNYYESTISLLINQVFSSEERKLIAFKKFDNNNSEFKLEHLYVISIQLGEECIYKVYNPNYGFVNASKEVIDAILIDTQSFEANIETPEIKR